jgi:hypothetical protein
MTEEFMTRYEMITEWMRQGVSDFVDTYGYPKDCFVGKQYRFSAGWFFIGEDDDEPACYMDFYFIGGGQVVLLLDQFWRGKEIELMDET